MARPRSDIRPRVIRAARARFLADGVDGSSLRGIAQDAGTSIGMIYYYFPTKDDLFLGVVEDVYAGLLEDLSVALSPDAPVEERIERLYRRAGAMSDVELTVIRIVIREALVSSSRLERLMERVARGHLPLLLATVQKGLDEGVLTSRYPVPIHLAAIGVLALFPQIARRVIGQTSPAILAMFPSADDLALLLSEVVLHGLAGPAIEKKAE
jgi:AcrR family transcriptional regulator